MRRNVWCWFPDSITSKRLEYVKHCPHRAAFPCTRLTSFVSLLQNCLGIIYTVYVENLSIPLETLVGNILGCIQVPPAGGPQVRFSIGAGDRQALQPPISPSLPITHTSVNLLFQQLGKRAMVSIINTMSVAAVSLTTTVFIIS